MEVWLLERVFKAAVKTDMIVFPSPPIDLDLGFVQRIEYLRAQLLVPQYPIRRLDIAVSIRPE